MGVGTQHCPLGLHALWGLRAAKVVGGRPQGGWSATTVRGASCQALSLPRPPVLWSGQPGFRDPCVPGAVGAGVGTKHRSHSVRPCGPSLLAVGVAEGRPRGGAFHRCEGLLRSGAVPLPTARPLRGLLGSATHVLWARVCGSRGPTLLPWPACTVGAACCGEGGGRPRGGWPATVLRGVWCQALSLPRPPVLWSGRPGFRDPCVPGAVGAGVGTQNRPHSVRAPLRAGVARCGGGGRASPGGVPSTIVRGVWGQAPSLSRPPARWAGRWGPPPTCCGRGFVGVGAQHCSLGLHAPWSCVPRGWWEPSPAGVACHRCEGRLVSGPVPPRPPVLLSGQPGFRDPCVPGAVGAGVGIQHRPHSVHPCGPALLAVGVAEGRPRGGCLPPL